MKKNFSFRSALVVPAFVALLLPSAVSTQQVQLLAGGDTEWSQYPYQPAVGYIHDDGGFRVPYLRLEENLDAIRERIGPVEFDVTYAQRHFLTIQHDLEFATEQEEWRHSFQRTRELIQSAGTRDGGRPQA